MDGYHLEGLVLSLGLWLEGDPGHRSIYRLHVGCVCGRH